MPQSLEQVVIEPAAPAKYAVIWLHGLGADGHDFAPIVPQLQLPHDNIRFIFPHAPHIPFTLNFGLTMPAWFDMTGLDRSQGIDFAGAKQSHQLITDIVDEQQAQGIAAEHIVLAGFSQGGALALYVGLTYSQPLAGVLALSTFLPHIEAHQIQLHRANQQIPIMFCHGSHDAIVPMHYATASVSDLKALGYQIDWHEYPIEHTVCPQEIADISSWLQQVLD